MAFIKTWWPALLVLGIFLALFAFEKWVRHDERVEVKKDVKIERLETENSTLHKDVQTRKKQNEVLVLDITPSDFDSILREHRF